MTSPLPPMVQTKVRDSIKTLLRLSVRKGLDSPSVEEFL